MNEFSMRKNHSMVSVDVEKYGDRNTAEQYEAQRVLRFLLEGAARAAGLGLDFWHSQWSGDGLFAVLPTHTSIGERAGRFIQELNVLLGAHNRRPRAQPWTPIRLKVALHEGPVRTDGATGTAGPPAVAVNRLIDADALRVALECCHGADLAVVVSERIFNDYIADGYGDLRPSEFREVHVAAKRKRRYLGYLYMPNCDLFKIRELDRFDDVSEAPRTDPPSAEPPRTAPRKIVYGSAHKISRSNVNETHSGDINLGDINLGGPR